jgi:preprotein translocase SecE subunit
VWDELRKVQWPTRDELARMTGIVIATVIIFAVIIGGADYILSLGVKQIYTTSGTTSPAASAAPRVSSAAAPTAAAKNTPVP